MSKFYVELKKVVDDSYDIEVGRNLFDTLVKDLKGAPIHLPADTVKYLPEKYLLQVLALAQNSG